MPDPTSPGYRAHYGGDDPKLGDIGADQEGFGASLYKLYRAGYHWFPDVAQEYYDMTVVLAEVAGALEQQTAAAGSPPLMVRMCELRDQLHRYFATTTEHVTDAGTALVQIADRYVATDEEAASEFNTVKGSVEERHYYKGPSPSVPEPPPVEAPTSPSFVGPIAPDPFIGPRASGVQ